MQDIFVKVWNRYDSFNNNSQLKTWIYKIAINSIYDYNRKFKQTFNLDEMTLNLSKGEFLIKNKFKTKKWNNRTLYSIYKEAQLPLAWHKKIFEKANKLGLICFSSVFDEVSLKFLEKINVPMYKIASLESLHFPLIKKVCKTKKPIIISTGTLSIKEIDKLIKFFKKINYKKFIILHCVTEYPANYKNINLKTIKYIKDKYKCLTGYSDHTKGVGVAISSINYGACVIEKHFMLSKKANTLDSNFSSDPNEMKRLVDEVKNSWEAIGKPKKNISKSESMYKNYRRSIYAITEKNIKIIRPGFGLSPELFYKILTKKANCLIQRGEPLSLKVVSK